MKDKRKKNFWAIGLIGSICSIIGLILYFYPAIEVDTRTQINTVVIKNSDSLEINQDNGFTSNKQKNEMLIDSTKNVKIKQSNK